MELILIQDLPTLGFKDDIINVKSGYGRNFLIPQKIAVLATTSQKKVLAENLKQRKHKEEKLIEEAKVKADKIKALQIKISTKAGKDGKLFGSISNLDLVDALVKEGVVLDKKNILIPQIIKNTGKYNAQIRLHREVIFQLDFEVAGI